MSWISDLFKRGKQEREIKMSENTFAKWADAMDNMANALHKIADKPDAPKEQVDKLVVKSTAYFDVVLRKRGPRGLEVVKIVKESTALGLREAKDLVDAFPCIVIPAVGEDFANSVCVSLNQVGADAEVIPTGTFQLFSVKLVLSNNTLVAVFPDGDVWTSVGGDELFQKVKAATSKDEVRTIMFPEVIEKEVKQQEIVAQEKEIKQKELEKEKEKILKEVKKAELTKEHVANLVNSGEFELKDDILYMKGINIGVPKLLLEKFVQLAEKVYNGVEKDIPKYELEYEALKNFWRWTSLCPNPQSREDMFKFLEKHDFKINKHGFFFAYRMVQSVTQAKKTSLAHTAFVSESKTKVKTWKKGATNYDIYQDGKNYILIDLKKKNADLKGIRLGNLEELYQGLSNASTEQIYTDAHTKSFDIRIGKEVSMDRRSCDEYNGRDCSKGLHIGNKSFGFGGVGDTSILVLINPMNAVSIPTSETNKMRVCAYYPVSVISGGESKMKSFLENVDVLELGDEYYLEQVAKLEKMVDLNNPQELGDKKIVAPEQTQASLKAIAAAFEEEVTVIVDRKEFAKAAVAKRVTKK